MFTKEFEKNAAAMPGGTAGSAMLAAGKKVYKGAKKLLKNPVASHGLAAAGGVAAGAAMGGSKQVQQPQAPGQAGMLGN